MPYGHTRTVSSGRSSPSGIIDPISSPAVHITSSNPQALSDLTDPSRTRLPPRSRTGCWTCRRRKVKCDESRPVCGQCSRLSQACDYGTRITFRDDTKTRMRKYSASSDLTGSPVWDVATHNHGQGPVRSPHLDNMAGFTSLTNDDDRERKASFHAPGTFNTVLRPTSFVSTLEDDDELKQLPLQPNPTSPSKPAHEPDRRQRSSPPIPHDANWIFLDRFEEDPGRQGASPTPADHQTSPFAPSHPFRQTHSPSHSTQIHSQPFSSEPMLYQLPGLRPYRSHPVEPTYMPLTHNTSTSYSAPPINIPQQQHTNHDPRTPQDGSMGQLHRLSTQGLTLARNNDDPRSSTTPFRRVSIPLSSASGSLLEEIVGLGNAPFYHLEQDEDEYVRQQQQQQQQLYQHHQQQQQQQHDQNHHPHQHHRQYQ